MICLEKRQFLSPSIPKNGISAIHSRTKLPNLLSQQTVIARMSFKVLEMIFSTNVKK